MYASKDSMWWRILKNFRFLSGNKQGLRYMIKRIWVNSRCTVWAGGPQVLFLTDANTSEAYATASLPGLGPSVARMHQRLTIQRPSGRRPSWRTEHRSSVRSVSCGWPRLLTADPRLRQILGYHERMLRLICAAAVFSHTTTRSGTLQCLRPISPTSLVQLPCLVSGIINFYILFNVLLI